MNNKIILLDIGGTWLKGSVVNYRDIDQFVKSGTIFQPVNIAKVESRLSEHASCSDFIEAIQALILELSVSLLDVAAIGISTAGVVDYGGTQILYTSPHLKAIRSVDWINYLKNTFNLPVVLVNDAEAVMLAAAKLGYLKGTATCGIMPIGTGLGFCVWRNARRWTPFYNYTLLGCINTPEGSYDHWASIVNLINKHPNITVKDLFFNLAYRSSIDTYINGLVSIIQSAYYMYHTSQIFIGGGLADIVQSIDFPLGDCINEKLMQSPLVDGTIPHVCILKEGNQLALLGAALLTHGECIAKTSHVPTISSITETPYDSTLMLHTLTSEKIVNLLWSAEQESGLKLKTTLPLLSKVVDKIVEKLKQGGRIIYVGAGTSGRLAAIDTVEIACTFGFPRSRVLTLVAGGIADASIDIETNFEEDASCLPDLLATGISAKDIIIGISVSGSAYYVQSALAYAKTIGAYSVLIQEEGKTILPFCNDIIGLFSGSEVLSGSTRMKAGTATKKVLNFISTTTMIQLGRVYGYYMIGLECANVKLQKRAQIILMSLFNFDAQKAFKELEKSDFVLIDVICRFDRKINLTKDDVSKHI